MTDDTTDYTQRQVRMRAAMAQADVSNCLITHLPNIRYLSGFTGSAGVLALNRRESRFFTDGRYLVQSKEEVRADGVEAGIDPLRAAVAWTRGAGAIGLDHSHLTVRQAELVRQTAKRVQRCKDVTGMAESLRVIKDRGELQRIRAAVDLGHHLFQRILKHLRAGVTEVAVAAEIEYDARQRGAEAMSFETIVASGQRSALPHGVASRQRLPARGFVVLDFGVILSGYCSDMTRTVHLGKPSAEARRIYEAVREAQEAAICAVRPGNTAHQVDATARNVLQKKGLAKFFIHSTGHGVGLEIHENPRIARKCGERLKPGMVITIEPGVYLPGKCGVRIEDMVVVTENGCKVLTPTTKELIVV